MPYDYIIGAINATNEIRLQRLHEYERPIAVLAWQQAEMNRDKKKRRKPYSFDDFYLYNNKNDIKGPDSRYGAAAKRLIEINKFPSWALFVYKDLIAKANDAMAPDDLAAIAEDCIVLAPTYEDFECNGMLIAMHSASNQIREFTMTDGSIIQMRIPAICGSVEAIEEAKLKILR